MRKWLGNILVLLLTAHPAGANDPFLDMLNKRGNNREAILREFEDIQGINRQAPQPAPADSAAPADSDASDAPLDAAAASLPAEEEAAEPQFRLLTPQPSESASTFAEPTSLALILPTDAAGLASTFAERFYEGCTRAVAAAGSRMLIHLYATDGAAASAVAAYEQALADGASMVIGPMRKQSVAAVKNAHPDAPLPTLLLQPADGGGYYVLTINVEEEIAELARHLAGGDYRMLLVADESAASQRQASAFAAAWSAHNHQPIERFFVYDKSNDWNRLFEKLKDQSVEASETPVEQSSEEEDAPQTALFAAGNGAFVRNVRNFSPQGYPVFASSVFHSGEEGAAAMFLENLQIMEMPWFLTDESELRELEAPLTRSRPVLQQRFYALGADACRIAAQTPLWYDGWEFAGVSGDLELRGGTFVRRGKMARYESGFLRQLKK